MHTGNNFKNKDLIEFSINERAPVTRINGGTNVEVDSEVRVKGSGSNQTDDNFCLNAIDTLNKKLKNMQEKKAWESKI